MPLKNVNVPEDTLQSSDHGTKLTMGPAGATILDIATGVSSSFGPLGTSLPMPFNPTASDGSAFIKLHPPEAGLPDFFARLGGATFAGAFDPVTSIGWNVDSAGLPVNSNYGTVAINFEGYYKTQNAQEFHVVYGMKDGSAQTRLFTSYGDQTTGYVFGAFNFTQFDFIDQVGSASLLSIATANAAAGARRITVGPGVGLYVGDGSANCSIVFNNTHSISSILADSFQLAALSSLPLKLYGSAAGAGSIIARTAMTIGGTGDKATTVANLTLTPEASQTAALLDMSGASATLPLMKVVATSDTPTGASSTFLKVLVGATPFYIALKAAS